jgi:hypothetical protein
MNGFELLMLASVLIGVLLPAWYAWRWQGLWRWLVILPAVFMVLIVVNLIVAITLDPSSHNMWPFEILMALFVSFIVVGGLRILREIFVKEK